MSGTSLGTGLLDEQSSFREDAPRPPVPGEECQTPSVCRSRARNEDGLGEPEGSASPHSPAARWRKSLGSLLGDHYGAHLFRTFLERHKCVDTLDFWFACNGFRQMDIRDPKTLRVAKAIHKRYIDGHGVVSQQLKPPTKVYIRDAIRGQRIDSAMFDRSQAEIQTLMEEKSYRKFLASDIYLEYETSNCLTGDLKLLQGYLPTLNEDEELNCGDLKHKSPPSIVALSSKALRATAGSRAKEAVDQCYRSYKQSDPLNPYRMNPGYVFAPAASANESEVSSDAATDDSMSLTDSSVDGIPPYRHGNKKLLQREMQRSVKANGRVTLPHFPRTHRLPREMTPIEPAIFAADLIARLEKVKREQETMTTLEERLQKIKEEEEREDGEPSMCLPARRDHPSPCHQPLSLASSEDDPQTILDDHLSRVLRSPGCQSPGVGRSRSPDRSRLARSFVPPVAPSAPCPVLAKSFVTKQTTKHIHHHYIHHHSTPRSQEEMEASRRVHCLCAGPADYCCYTASRAHAKGTDLSLLHAGGTRGRSLPRKSCAMLSEYAVEGIDGAMLSEYAVEGIDGATLIYQLPIEEPAAWQREAERQHKHRSHSAQNTKRSITGETRASSAERTDPRASSAERTDRRASSAERTDRRHQWRHPQPLHSLVQDLAVASPSTLAQLEEACQRLAEASRPAKQRCPLSSHQRSQSVPCQPAPSMPAPADHKEPKRPGPPPAAAPGELTVTYFFCGEEIPYRRMMKTPNLTLGHFKEQLSKKGNYRFYFKKPSQEFECGAVFEEIREDAAVLPTYEGRVLGKVERID